MSKGVTNGRRDCERTRMQFSTSTRFSLALTASPRAEGSASVYRVGTRVHFRETTVIDHANAARRGPFPGKAVQFLREYLNPVWSE